jgi:hypothetical protein
MHHPDLPRNFDNSIYTAVTFNLGPQVVCQAHVDYKNKWNGLCAITAFGSYDPTTSGHIVLWDLKKIIQFPPGSTILCPSATLRHSNIPVKSHETRLSMTQYVAGGLFRWVQYGFRTEKDLKAFDGDLLQTIKQQQEQRREEGLAMFSKIDELHNDRINVWGSGT